MGSCKVWCGCAGSTPVRGIPNVKSSTCERKQRCSVTDHRTATAKCKACGKAFEGRYDPTGLPTYSCPHCSEHHTGHQFLVAVTDYSTEADIDQAERRAFRLPDRRSARLSELEQQLDTAVAKLTATAALLIDIGQAIRQLRHCRNCGTSLGIEVVTCCSCVSKKVDSNESQT